MVTFINGNAQTLGANAQDCIVLLQSAFSQEGWQISNNTSVSFTISNGPMYYDFAITQSPSHFNIDTTASYTKAYSQQEINKFTQTIPDWLNIIGHDNIGNYSFNRYNLGIDGSQSRLFAAISSNNFAICIGSLAKPAIWDAIYGGMLDDAQDADAWGIGYADCRLRVHQIYKARATNELWHMIGSDFHTISSSQANNAKTNLQYDRLSQGNRTYNAPNAGLLDYFTTFTESFGNTAILDLNYLTANLRYTCVYGARNVIDDCAILMPAFYLEGTGFNTYGSATLTDESPLLYYRGTLPFIYSGGLSLLQGVVLERANAQKFISTGQYFKLCMRIS